MMCVTSKRTMASKEAGVSTTVDSSVLQLLKGQFFQMIPMRRIRWKGKLADYENIGSKEQEEVLNATVLSPLCQKFPPSLSYRKAFMKQLISKLEELDAEICDEMYETYTDLLQQGETDDEDMLCHKTYFLVVSTLTSGVRAVILTTYHAFSKFDDVQVLYPHPHRHQNQFTPNGDRVSLQESVNIISQGTTGLSTWQAALNLAEWAVEKCRIFDNRKVLELGSGLGMTGLAICKQCHVKSYTFSDCHYQVLYLLMRNIEINLSQRETNSEETNVTLEPDSTLNEKKMMKSICRQLSVNSEITSESNSDIMKISYSSMVSSTDGIQEDLSYTDCDHFEPNALHWNTTDHENMYELKSDDRVRLAKLDWESSKKLFIESLDPDIILAADVVYDKSIIPALVFVLHTLLAKTTENGEKPVAYVASTIRNEDTRDHFLILLGTEGLSYTTVEPPKEKVFFYDDVIPVEILKIYKS